MYLQRAELTLYNLNNHLLFKTQTMIGPFLQYHCNLLLVNKLDSSFGMLKLEYSAMIKQS